MVNELKIIEIKLETTNHSTACFARRIRLVFFRCL
jgi:hypothetical protein